MLLKIKKTVALALVVIILVSTVYTDKVQATAIVVGGVVATDYVIGLLITALAGAGAYELLNKDTTDVNGNLIASETSIADTKQDYIDSLKTLYNSGVMTDLGFTEVTDLMEDSLYKTTDCTPSLNKLSDKLGLTRSSFPPLKDGGTGLVISAAFLGELTRMLGTAIKAYVDKYKESTVPVNGDYDNSIEHPNFKIAFDINYNFNGYSVYKGVIDTATSSNANYYSQCCIYRTLTTQGKYLVTYYRVLLKRKDGFIRDLSLNESLRYFSGITTFCDFDTSGMIQSYNDYNMSDSYPIGYGLLSDYTYFPNAVYYGNTWGKGSSAEWKENYKNSLIVKNCPYFTGLGDTAKDHAYSWINGTAIDYGLPVSLTESAVQGNVIDSGNEDDDIKNYPIGIPHPDSVVHNIDDIYSGTDNPANTDTKTNTEELAKANEKAAEQERTEEATAELVAIRTGVQDVVFGTGITTKFPFCIPFDLIRLLTVLKNDSEAPKFSIPLQVKAVGLNTSIDIDLSKFETVAVVIRWCETFGFIFFLIVKTRDLIKG